MFKMPNAITHGQVWSRTVAALQRPGTVANGLTGIKKCVYERSVRFKLELNTITGLYVPTDKNVEDWGQANVGALKN